MIVFVGLPRYRENEKLSLEIGQDFIGMLLRNMSTECKKDRFRGATSPCGEFNTLRGAGQK
jgi:hypothetical protein